MDLGEAPIKKLVILRGAPGSGKSSLVEREGLQPFTVSSDAVRLLLRGPERTWDGGAIIPNGHNAATWRLVHEALEHRMRRGDLTVVDATHAKISDMGTYKKLVERHGYEAIVVDFSAVPLDECLRRNRARVSFRFVPEAALTSIWQTIHDSPGAPRWARVVRPDELRSALREETLDFSKWRRIHHVGDVQGCASALEAFLKGGIAGDDLVIFVGDYLDRGVENARALTTLMELARKPNVIMIEGNHERHLRAWAAGEEANSREFTGRTQPELEAAKIDKGEVREFLDRLRDVVRYRAHGREVIVTHAGLPFVPTDDEMVFIPSSQMIRGVGGYDDPVDEAFSAASAGSGVFQVHGHRNRRELPTAAAERSFNLEGRVEFGGELRVVTLSDEGWEVRAFKNDVYDRSSREAVEITSSRAPSTVTELVAQLRASDLVHEKDLGDGISSFNFSRKAFYDKAWNDQTVRARGLFIDVARNEIVARSYDKFFNLGERPETTPEALAATLSFPLDVWVKENGFLGILGLDQARDRLFFCSKSTCHGDFAAWFRKIVMDTVSGDEARLRKFLAGGYSLVFEVIDPVNDPHIIKYDSPRVILLDAVRNDVSFSRLPHEHLAGLAKSLGFEVKKRHRTIKDAAELEAFLASCKAGRELVGGREVEGFVVEDAALFNFKVKCPYYDLWKSNRFTQELVLRGKGYDPSKVRPQSLPFHDWLVTLPRETQERDIISLRELFEKSQDG